MDILNFISWIKGGRVVTTVDPAKTLIPVGLKDDRRDDGYLAGAITVEDLTTQLTEPVIDANGNTIIDNTSDNLVVIPDGVLPADFIQVIPNFSGMLTVNDHNDGGVEVWVCGGGDCTLVSSTSASSGGGLMAQSGLGYEWANAQTLSGPFTFTVIKTRNEA